MVEHLTDVVSAQAANGHQVLLAAVATPYLKHRRWLSARDLLAAVAKPCLKASGKGGQEHAPSPR